MHTKYHSEGKAVKSNFEKASQGQSGQDLQGENTFPSYVPVYNPFTKTYQQPLSLLEQTHAHAGK